MPSFNTEGKSKEDLAIVAQLAGLLTLDQTSAMSRTEIARVIEKENRKLEAEANAALQPAKKTDRPSRGRRPIVSQTATAELAAAETQPPAATGLVDGKTGKSSVRPRKSPAVTAPATESPAAATAAIEPTAPPAPSEPADLPHAKKKAGTRPNQRTTAKSKTKPVELPQSVETSAIPPVVQLADQANDLVVELQPAAEPAETKQADTAPAPIEKTRKKPGRKPAVKSPPPETPAVLENAGYESGESTPDTDRRTEVDDHQTSADELSAEFRADRSPEAAEAATDRDNAPHGTRHVPPRHTLAPTRSGQRRTRNIGTSEPAQSQGQDARGNRGKPAPTRPVRTVRTIKPIDVTEPDDGAADQAVAGHLPEKGTSSVIPLPSAHEHEQAGSHRPAVEAGDVQAGILEIMPDGYGFLRKDNYLQGSKDIYVPPQYIRRFGLRMGDHVSGPVKLQRENDRYQALLYIKEVNGMSPEKMIRRPHFDKLTPIYPDERFILETVRNELSTRIIDLVAPIGKGQRGMIVSPPKAGKTILLQKIANAISINNPDVKLIVLLIDERPEEVTDMQRSINGEVVYSTFDKTPENHTKVTELVLERAMRLVELKQDVVILLDSMTRLARAYNLSINPTGRTLSGGLDPGALYGPKRFFGAARNIENGGSLTIIATSLIETGSRMDEVIFEEFKGTGNMEVYLDRKMSEKRIFPAIDINKSGTRREELLMSSKELDAVWTIRKAFGQLDATSVTEAIINLLLKTTNNQHFISSVNVSFNDKNVFEAMRGVKPSDNSQSGQSGAGGRSGGYGGYNSSGQASNYRRMTANDDD